MTTAEMAHREKLLRLRAAIADREAVRCRREADALEQLRLAEERRQTPIVVVAPSGRSPRNSRASAASHKLATAAAAAFGITYAQAYQMVAKAS